jgi:hypothetical protein
LNVWWIAILSVFVLLEKVVPRGLLVGKIAGVLLAAWGGVDDAAVNATPQAKHRRRGIFVVFRFVEITSSVGATSSGGRAEYAAPDGA